MLKPTENSPATASPTPTTTPSPTETPPITISQPLILPSGCISSDQALNIATPYVNQYLSEHDRTITNITVQFNAAFKDVFHERTGNALSYPDNTALSYPVWFVMFEFDSTPPEGSHLSYGYNGIISYNVGMWADNGQVFCQEEFAVC
jgi:hypothetical protein